MAVIEPIEYDEEGFIVFPDPAKVNTAIFRSDATVQGRFPTFDPGYMHVFVIRITNTNRIAAEEKFQTRCESFYSKMNQVDGCTMVQAHTTRGWDEDNPQNWVVTLLMAYAIEVTDNPLQGHVDPYPGYGVDLAVFNRPIETAAVLTGETYQQ